MSGGSVSRGLGGGSMCGVVTMNTSDTLRVQVVPGLLLYLVLEAKSHLESM